MLCLGISIPQASYANFMTTVLLQQQPVKSDTVSSDTIPPYTPTKVPTYKPSYRFGDPFSNRMSATPLQLTDPSSVDLQVNFDSSVNYSVYEKIGDVNFRPVTTMSFEEYDKYHNKQMTKDYFKERSSGLDGESAVSGRSLIPRLYISPVFDRLFGGSYVDIQPNGFVNLDFGGRWQRVDNPAIPIRQQRNGGFNFNQQISLNLVGKIGEKLAVTANFDNNNSFDYQNNLKVDYTGYAEDIVKKIEIGNVSMPVSNSLMTGAQSLFGVKTQLQFGKLFVTGVVSRQQGQSDVITVQNGFQGKEFDVRVANYDENKHFFLGHFFRDNYEAWHTTLPQINSGLIVNRVEVYVINRNNNTQSTRQVLGLMDLGEGQHIYRSNNPKIGAGKGKVPNDNSANQLFQSIVNTPNIRNKDNVVNILENDFGFENSTDFVSIGTARKLDNSEFVLNEKLGYITLLRKLQNDEMLAVSYEYSYRGQVYTVGELSNDYQQYGEDDVIIMKLLRPNKISPHVPTWNLMMKNIYNLNASQISQDGFTLRIHYRDDATGIDNPSLHEGRRTKDKPLLQLLGLDQLNMNNDHQPDGNFDFIEGVTIDTKNGNVMFPVLEPFGKTLNSYFEPDEVALKEKYVFDTLYRSTRADAMQITSKNKFVLLGKYNAGSSSEIALPGINISPNSVVVTAGNTPLTEGLDYTVDYNLGRVRILNEGILSSGKTINISYEKADLFNFQSRWLYGVRADYKFSDKFNIGATLLQLNERPGGISRYTIGNEPTRNTKYGFDINYQNEAPFLTKMMDFLPLVSTKAPSSLSFNAEFAQMKPATSNLVNGKGTSYIDDFESAVSPINLSGWAGWKLGSVPETEDRRFDLTTESGKTLGKNYRRAKMAWYSVDQSVFYRAGTGGNKPPNIEKSDLDNHYVRGIAPKEIYRQRSNNVVVTPLTIFDIAYFPSERGPYNYNPNLTRDGLLPNPQKNFGAITRAITNEVDFDKTNVEYLEFWMMDPFIEGENGRVLDGVFNTNNTTGGDLVFNLGSVSEDLIPDGRHGFESGLPTDGDTAKTVSSEWGRVPSQPFLVNYFENNNQADRANQDVGFEGLRDDQESEWFGDFINNLTVTSDVMTEIKNDPSADNFHYYLGTDYDAANKKILERYKNFNGTDGNTPILTGNELVRASTTIPDNEDVNNDQTIIDLEQYYEYKLSLKPGQLDIGKQHIVDKITSGEATWYLFRIPIRNPDRVYGGISGFKTMRYVRMYATNFSQPVVFRMSKLQLVGSQWRKYQEALNEPGLNEVPEATYSDFNVSVVNIEENSTAADGKSPYVIPPGLNRDHDNTSIVNKQINEQSLKICVDNLADKDARGVFKNISLSLINYGRLKMFMHAEAYNGGSVSDDEVHGFLRFGTDFTENYYEIEIPLKITPANLTETGDALRRAVWPLENEIDLSINELLGLKSARSRADYDEKIPYTSMATDNRQILTIKGRPDMSDLRMIMIGIKNPESNDRASKSVCLWTDELRVTDFDTRKGWAANARLSAKLADVATISASAKYSSIGFGGIQQTIQQRNKFEQLQYDISANINADKFLLPEKTGLKIPMFVSLERSVKTPQFDPLNPDVPLDAALVVMKSDAERARYRRIVEDRTEKRSLNFTNVHKEKVNPDARSHFFDIENLSFSYAYSDQHTNNISTQEFVQKNISGGVAYNYSFQTLSIEPFKNAEFLKSPYLKLIKDINLNLLPTNVSVRGDLNRIYQKTQLYNEKLTTDNIDPYFQHLFTFNRNYSFRWSPFKSLNVDYSAKASAIIDEIDSITPIRGDINTKVERQYIWNEIKNLGRMKSFNQSASATYKVPFDKFPLTDWVSANLKYSVNYTWTAGSKTQYDSLFFGNTAQNNRERGLSGKVDLVKLYNKVAFLKEINSPPRKKRGEEENVIRFNPVTAFLRTLMSIRNVNVSYDIKESTTLAGFGKRAYFMGMDSTLTAPGWDFIFGGQNPNIRYRAADNNWLNKNPGLTTPFMQTYTENLSLRAAIEPGKDLKIQLDAKRTNNATFQEIFHWSDSASQDVHNGFVSSTPTRKGSYSISFMSIQTAFDKNKSNNSSKAYEAFVKNVQIIKNRQDLRNTEPGYYDSLSQDVLIPAFIAAYSDKSASGIALSPFPKIPIPGWNVSYNGLSKLPGFSEIFSSVSLTHGYQSLYNVNDYTFNMRDYGASYSQGVTLNNNVLNYPLATVTSDSGKFAPVYNMNQVTISEQFAPLIGLNVRTKNNLSTRIEYKKARTLSLNMSNAQVTETTSQDVTLDFGYSKEGFKLPFKAKGRVITLENAVTMRMSMTLRDAETIQRKLQGDNKVTNGNTNFQMRPSMTYKINQQLDLTMYFERTVTEPKISSFKTATTAFGAQLRFSLAQ